MNNFMEYVKRRDEANFNRFSGVDVPLHTLGAAAGMPQAAWNGINKVAPQYRSMAHGNPYKSDTPENTVHVAETAFQQARDWLLDSKQHAEWLLSQLHQVQQYVSSQKTSPANIAGVAMGKQPSTLGRVFALPAALITGIVTAAKNAVDTMNPYASRTNSPAFADAVKKMLLALDAMPVELAERRLNEFISVLRRGGTSSYIDADARYRS